ncbi:hypothetical protein [Actinoplanes hulinensis]|uniref:hypothetical protein n=1 Tax=Actinoplanes hulinensis TaxID=1144547 RepID=UPI003558060F
METPAGWGLRPELGEHALDRRGFLAGRDEDRLADVNDALRDPGVRRPFKRRARSAANEKLRKAYWKGAGRRGSPLTSVIPARSHQRVWSSVT